MTLPGAVLVAALVLASSLPGGQQRPAQAGPTRLVLSSLGGERALAQSTVSLYAKNDPWRPYLATERICPGGERTDLPEARQIATVACLVNYARERRGLHKLIVRPVLNGASARKANAIIRCANFAHNPCGGDWRHATKSVGYAGEFGENLYLANGPWAAPRVAVDAWLNSASHRMNLFRRQWRDQGITLLAGQSFGGYADVSLWVSVLGDR